MFIIHVSYASYVFCEYVTNGPTMHYGTVTSLVTISLESKRGAFSRFPLCNIYSYSSQAILQARLTLKSDAAYVAILRIKWHFKSSTQCDVRQVREIQFHLFSDVMCSCCACITFVLSFSSYVKLGLISR